MVSNVPLPTPGKDRVLFAIDNVLLSVETPPKDGLPHVDVQPLTSSSLLSCVPLHFAGVNVLLAAVGY